MDGSNPGGIGHNNPPAYDADIAKGFAEKAAEWLNAAQVWIKKGKLETSDDAERLNDFITGVKANKKAADAQRVLEKKVHDEAGKAVQAAYKPVLEKLDLAVQRVNPLLTDWMNEKERERLAEVERQRKEAAAAAAEAQRIADEAAKSGDLGAEVDAQAAKEAAEEQAKAVARSAKNTTKTASATGGGRTASLRSYNVVKIKNQKVAIMHYMDHPKMAAFLVGLAEADARLASFDPEKDSIPGFTITVEKKAV